MRDIMIDLETLGTGQDAIILSGAAVRFDRNTGELGESLYYKFDADSGLNINRKRDEDTIAWWNSQKDSVRQEAFNGKEDLAVFLDALGNMVGDFDRVWGNGATFDISMLENAVESIDAEKPWKFWNVRDVRTVVDLAAGFVSRGPKPKELHNPVVDCEYQIKYLCKMMKVLRG